MFNKPYQITFKYVLLNDLGMCRNQNFQLDLDLAMKFAGSIIRFSLKCSADYRNQLTCALSPSLLLLYSEQ